MPEADREIRGTMSDRTVTGRFAPSPTGRMHLGNVAAALASWLSVRSRGGRWILRIEDLDPQRSRMEYSRTIEDDLRWLGLDWDEGGTAGTGSHGPYMQSLRSDIYREHLERLKKTRLTYPCHCTRADIMATQAPHESDGRVVYAGTCRPSATPPFENPAEGERRGATRLYVPDREIVFDDRVYGRQSVNLAHHCGDFVLQRADGAWAYQLAVVVDDALMGVTEVTRGCDLLLSSAQQIYLYGLLGYETPEFAHIPLVVNAEGRRLSKRDASLSMATLREKYSAEAIIGRAAALLGLLPEATPVSAAELAGEFAWEKIPAVPAVTVG